MQSIKINKMFKILILSSLLIFSNQNLLIASSNPSDFNQWLISFKNTAIKKGISKKTVDASLKNVRFLENVIKYDRKQPEFFEDTLTYISKRATTKRVNYAKKILSKNKLLLNEIEYNFNVEKEILLSLWAIETNFGRHVGKMDIISSLATLSFDKRRSKFFTHQLLTLLELIDNKIVDPDSLYGSWAGAYGNFQFMPTTISNYAIDYDKDDKIDLKNSLHDSLASAANYINKIGWKNSQPCFIQVKLTKKIKDKYLNKSARSIKNKLKISYWKKMGIVNLDGSEIKSNYKSALIIPDGNQQGPTYLVFDNYEKILKWNRSLRFGITVCTLSNKIGI